MWYIEFAFLALDIRTHASFFYCAHLISYVTCAVHVQLYCTHLISYRIAGKFRGTKFSWFSNLVNSIRGSYFRGCCRLKPHLPWLAMHDFRAWPKLVDEIFIGLNHKTTKFTLYTIYCMCSTSTIILAVVECSGLHCTHWYTWSESESWIFNHGWYFYSTLLSSLSLVCV